MIRRNRISTVKRNKYAEIESPWRAPLLSVKYYLVIPQLMTHNFWFFKLISVHEIWSTRFYPQVLIESDFFKTEIMSCSLFSFKLTNDKTFLCTYKNSFSCGTKYLIYILIIATVFILDNLKNLFVHHELFYVRWFHKSVGEGGGGGGGMFGHSTTGYAENILEIATKQSNIFKYFILFWSKYSA